MKTRWVIGPRTSSTSVDDIDITTGPLKARFVAKGYSQYISDHIKEPFAATPSSTSLRTLLLHAVLHQYQVTSCDISSAFLNTPIEEDIYVQPPPEVYQHRPRVIWKLHRALYGLRTYPKMWQEHLHSTLVEGQTRVDLANLAFFPCFVGFFGPVNDVNLFKPSKMLAGAGGRLATFSFSGVSQTIVKHSAWEQCPQVLAGKARKVAKSTRLCSYTLYTSRTTTTPTEGRQVRVGEAKPHGFGPRRRLAHRRNVKGDIIVSGATSTISQLETLQSLPHNNHFAF